MGNLARLILRAVLWPLTHSLLWLRADGRQLVPAQGAVLLVGPRLTYLDWLWLWLATPRPVRCFLFAGWTRHGLGRRLANWTGAITLDSDADEMALERAVQEAAEALKRGEAVALFVERLRTSRLTLTFPDLLRRLRRLASAPIVAVSVDQPEGSLFGYRQDRHHFDGPQCWSHPIHVSFGTPLPAELSAGEVVQAVQQLSADAAEQRSYRLVGPHREFVRHACRHPFRPCLVDSTNKKNVLSYGKALAGAICLANRLRRILGNESMAAIWLPPGVGAALSNLALALLRKTSVNLNYTSSQEGVQAAVRQCRLRHVLTARRFTARVPLDPIPGVEFIYLDELLPTISGGQKLAAFLQVLLLPGWLLERGLGLHRHDIEDLATLIFSSGSTGDPKGVMLTHRNVMANVKSMVQFIGYRGHDRALGVLPLFHSFGYTVTLWVPLTGGGSVVYHADPRQAKEIGELCREFGCTIFLITPTFLRFCLKKCDEADFRTLRLLMCGAEKLPPSLAADFQGRFGVQPLEGYGCTELAPAAAANLWDEESDGCVQVNNKVGTIGPPLPGVAVRVVDPDTAEPLPLGQEGMLRVRGPNAMMGYLHRPDLTAQVLQDGEYETGDMARLDEDGHITLTGRLSRFAKVGGEMVPLEKVEEELLALLEGDGGERPLAVTAVPDERRGERVVVLYAEGAVEPRALAVRLAEQGGLPNLWLPGERDFYVVTALPLLGSGKLDLRRLKEVALSAVRGSREVVRS